MVKLLIVVINNHHHHHHASTMDLYQWSLELWNSSLIAHVYSASSASSMVTSAGTALQKTEFLRLSFVGY